MIRAVFRYAGDAPRGFSLCGHAGAGVAGEDVVCAAVSSAAYMAANTVTDVVGAKATVDVGDGALTLEVFEENAGIKTVMDGFFLHMKALQEQYPERIQVLKTEV